ncbi:type 2 periplasmic-binding domain-containing protein [Agrobacterium fabrum]|uniref:hypothetical protein n=1 Tax=Agrobacterium fabrum TaxID=1176649 RepID=UPI0021D0AAA4|nr:hypothetical protein [Agrobacterium fabrum]
MDPFKAVVSTDHRLAVANRRTVELWELAQEQWALNQAAVGYQSFIVNACMRKDTRRTSWRAAATSLLRSNSYELGASSRCYPVLPRTT